ncbi:MAG: glycogen debranching protein GlgX [Burkholderiaceae bacterium]
MRLSTDGPALLPGKTAPLGAHWDGHGVNFAVSCASADALTLCLFDAGGKREIRQLALHGPQQDVWHGYLPDAGPGTVYGMRAHGPWQPDQGQRFNPAKLLLDPYAREVVGQFRWSDPHFAAQADNPTLADSRDNAACALKARVVDDAFDWGADTAPRIAAADVVLYELHVRGFSRRNEALPPALRGTYAGLAHPASIAYLQGLGITSVSLLPVHYALDEQRLSAQGLRNYWGYNTLAFFYPDPRLASQYGGVSPRDEFRAMVRALHAAGFEVILDVVFNHTAEGDEHGPSISFRGLDNAGYYRLSETDRSRYDNYSGCGNTLDARRPQVLRLVMDSLRFWVQEMHVDGFRFDLAPVLGRTEHGFTRDSPFFMALAQDPALSGVKLIAEPWDLGPGGYQSGGFPRGWMEWNDRYRDGMRRFWLGWHYQPGNGQEYGLRGDFALRLCGSSDMFQAGRRPPQASVNYVVSHDGFTLRDLVSYNNRHNQANGENNRDGHAETLSFNCGFEGETEDAGILALRARLQRALLACTILSQGTPMLCAGAERGQTQGGNNNPYNQDNETTWLDWSQTDTNLTAFTARLLKLRRAAMPLGADWYSGHQDPLGLCDLCWMRSDGRTMEQADWHDTSCRTLACLIGRPGRARAPMLLLVNAGTTAETFHLPGGVWQCLLDTSDARGDSHWHGQGDADLPVAAHSLQLLAAAGAGVTGAP